MSGPNFASMSFQELRAYVLEHREHLRKSSERYRNKKA